MCRLITYRSPIDFGSIVKVTIRLDCLTPHKYYKGRSLLIGGHNVKISRVKVMVIGQVYLQNLLPKNNFSINQILVLFLNFTYLEQRLAKTQTKTLFGSIGQRSRS